MFHIHKITLSKILYQLIPINATKLALEPHNVS